MSRILVEKHPNGADRLVAGHDRPLDYFFVDRYDEEEEQVGGVGLLGPDGPCPAPADAARYLREQGVAPEKVREVFRLLQEHRWLEYPASNVKVDLTS